MHYAEIRQKFTSKRAHSRYYHKGTDVRMYPNSTTLALRVITVVKQRPKTTDVFLAYIWKKANVKHPNTRRPSLASRASLRNCGGVP